MVTSGHDHINACLLLSTKNPHFSCLWIATWIPFAFNAGQVTVLVPSLPMSRRCHWLAEWTFPSTIQYHSVISTPMSHSPHHPPLTAHCPLPIRHPLPPVSCPHASLACPPLWLAHLSSLPIFLSCPPILLGFSSCACPLTTCSLLPASLYIISTMARRPWYDELMIPLYLDTIATGCPINAAVNVVVILLLPMYTLSYAHRHCQSPVHSYW